jgi:hypothetical protein
MYSRNYFENELPTPAVPENYVGTAFGAEPEQPPDEPETAPVAAKPSATPHTGLLGSLNLPFLSGIKLPEIGSEEILIIAVALFLLLSQHGDKECAIMLLLLLLIN